MDTKTPTIPLKYQEKKQQSKKKDKTTGDVSLPPLTTPLPNGIKYKNKNQGQRHWSRDIPFVNQDPISKHPYRILHLGATPLMHACQQADRSRVLRLLKEQEETICYRDRTLRSALHYCMDAGTAGAVASTAPELVNSSDNEGHTPLHLAVIAGDTQLVAVLLANGADVNAKDLEGHSVLHWATVCGEAECVRLVLASGARPSTPDLRGGSPLHYAAQCCGAAVTAELSVPKKIGLKVLQTLLEFNADVNAKDEDGRQPILWAASAGSVEAVLALVRAGGAAAAGATDKDGLTALHCAASRGHARCVEALVNLCGSQPDHVDDNGCSALHYAATLGHADATALLLRLGADPNRQDRKGRTPALCAAAKGQLETLKMLAQHGGSLNARTIRGTGVAHEAVLSGRIELLKWLARKKPSTLDVSTNDGRMPLHVAALHGHLDACKILLDNDARINAIFKTNKGGTMTPLDAALYRGHRDCAKLIQMHGGTTSQHLRNCQTAPNRVFAAKLRIKKNASESSTTSECDFNHHRCHNADVYIEEHWIEKRTRRRNTKKNKNNRSYSEEKICHLKSSKRERERRAKSESARYKINLNNEKPCKKKYSRHEYSESTSSLSSSSSSSSASSSNDLDDESSDNDDDDDDKEKKKKHSNKEKHSSLSDDSLEVVVVKKLLEKKMEKVEYSDRKSKTPRELSRETITECEKNKKSTKKNDKLNKKKKRDNSDKKNSNNEKTNDDNIDNKKELKKKKLTKDTTDSTSQEAGERVTVTAMIHKDQSPDRPIENTAADNVDQQLTKSEMDDILEKADNMQNSLMNKAADLRKDVKDIRSQRTKEIHADDDKNIDDKSLSSSKTEDSSSLDDVTTENSTESSQSNDSQLKKNQNQNDDRTLEHQDDEKIEEIIREETPMPLEDNKKSIETSKTTSTSNSTPDKLTNENSSKHSKSSSSEKENSQIKNDSTSESETLISKNENLENIVDDNLEKKLESTESLKNDEIKNETSSELEKIDKEKNFDDKPLDVNHNENSSSEKSSKNSHSSRPSTGKTPRKHDEEKKPKKSTSKSSLFDENCENEQSSNQSAIIAVIQSPEWDDEDEQVAKEISDVVGDNAEPDTDPDDDEDDSLGVVRVLPSTSDEGSPSTPPKSTKNQTPAQADRRLIGSPVTFRPRRKQRKDSTGGGGGGGRDSGIEPSPRVSKIPKRNIKCYPNTKKQQALNMETITRDVSINLRRYHLERKIFFQLMELKRLQIRHGQTNENVLVKRQVEAFHKAGMAGPALGVARYDQPLTFKNFEGFLYEQLRRLQRRPPSPDWCTDAKQCTLKTHRCHHATSAYTSVPIYTYR
ncbi:ankycorbin isoform X2 [Aphidius gifuensis]|uniref:ankycorbin isoform X2 n=1 Tax=Aphidius gifuensis TaxID=684658 RepID=UPI001CDD058A|nr:ankycorbin isoform X2 [Aphidius gifuensis]